MVWATLSEALRLVTYESDKAVLRSFIAYIEKAGI